MRPGRVLAVARKEWHEILRDRIYFMLAFILPPMLMLVFCYGISQDVENVPFALLDYDRSHMSRDYAHHYIVSRYFNYRGDLGDIDVADRLLANGDVGLVLVIPDRFQERLLSGQPTAVQALVDGTFPQRARTVQGYMEAINAIASGEMQVGYVSKRLGVSSERAQQLLQPLRLEVRYLYNTELRSVWNVSASMIMFILIMTAPLLAALSVVREKETGSIYNIYASTIRRIEFILGKLLPNVLISFSNALVLWFMAIWYFGAPFKGSIPFFLLATLLYVVCTSSLGLLVSMLVRTQQAALVITVILSVIIALQFSGMLTPVALLTGPNYVMAHLLPAMYYQDIVLGAFLKGAGWVVLWWEALVLAGYSLAVLAVVYVLFRKRTRA
jgi:ABC-2 type transport system permease protein/ribosome-dependent ATPase